MNLLLDTHVVLWWLADDRQLGEVARREIVAAGRVLVSAVTPWEIEIKRSLGRLEIPDDHLDAVTATGFELLAITAHHAVVAGRLPLHHRDPFDRMLVAQAVVEELQLVSADTQLTRYGVPVLDARA